MSQSYISLGQAIEQFLEAHGLKDETEVQKVILEWGEYMGAPIAANTEKIWYRDGTLFVKMRSPIWKNELLMARVKIQQMINQRVGRELVREVKVL
ncbi:MAG: DUF721 domain-containing protein [Bacteroidota bacterium]